MNNGIWKVAPRRLAKAAGVIALFLLAVPGVAMAHADLVSSTPADGSTVKAGLTEIVLTFNEEISVDQSTGELEGSGGATMSGVTMLVDRAERTKMLIKTAPLAAGSYTVKWKSVTEDDNGIKIDSFSFTVAAEGGSQTRPTPDIGGQGGTQPEGGNSGSLPGAGVPEMQSGIVALALAAVCLLGWGISTLRRGRRVF